jgi:hypothetical protein
MAGCERGYLCTVCGEEVEEITDSDLYLRYVLGEAEWETLNRAPERHIRCDPVLAQFIAHPTFEPVACAGLFSKTGLDPDFVDHEETRVTTAYLRLRELATANLPISDYPLADVLERRLGGFPMPVRHDPDPTISTTKGAHRNHDRNLP